jgi:RNA polymerase sigma-70 factor, ECF subfamily
MVDVAGQVTASARASTDEERRALWTAYYPPLAGWCAALVGDVDVAHDIASESFVRLLGRWSTVQQPKAFLYTVAANLAKDHWRRQDSNRRLLRRIASSTDDVAPAADPWLRDLVERLPDRLRMPVLLHYYADLPVSDVATALGRPEGTIKRLLAEGRAALLQHDRPDDG